MSTRNPFEIKSKTNTLEHSRKRIVNPFQVTKPTKQSKPIATFFDLLKSNDISRASEFALDQNKQAIKKQKLEEDLEEDKENIPPDHVPNQKRMKQKNMNEVMLDKVVLDWSVKTKTTIISKFPFDWINLKPNDDTKAMMGFVQNQQMDDTASFHGLLCRWVHQERFPPSFGPLIATLIVKERGKARLTDKEVADLQYFKEKEQQWYIIITRKLSFKSAYRMMRNGESSMLMYSNNSFAVVFEHKEGNVTAIMTKSSFGIRSMLRKQGITYSLDIDFEAIDGTDLDSETIVKESDEFVTKEAASKAYDGSLVFTTKATAHALFDFLLNWTDSRLAIRCSSTPTILAPKPFLGARLEQAVITKSMVKSKDSKTNLYKVCFVGSILPTFMHSILEIIQRKQTRLDETDCLVVFETDEQTIIKEKDSFKTIEFKNQDIIASKI